MNIEARKIEFMKEFLKLQKEEVILSLEKVLRKENSSKVQDTQEMTKERLNKRIEKSELDFQNNRFKSSSELLDKY